MIDINKASVDNITNPPSFIWLLCVSLNSLTARVLISAIQTWYYPNRRDTYKVFDSWIFPKWLCSKVIYAVIYLEIDAAIILLYEVLFVFKRGLNIGYITRWGSLCDLHTEGRRSEAV